jgi:phage baseplate assembly protein W
MPSEHDELPGAGWGFPVTSDHKGDIDLSEGEASVEDAIRIILGTAKGERVMQPDFGCEIHDHAFDSVDGTTLTLIEGSVREALIEWEPRIDLNRVDAGRDPENPNRILVEIDYTIRSTNSEANMVYPFYVNR